jgi:hypothetical protein
MRPVDWNGVGEELFVAYFEIRTFHSPGENREKYGSTQSGH